MKTGEIEFLRSCAPDEECFQRLIQYVTEQQRYRYLFDATEDGVIIAKDGVIIDANPAVSRMFGYRHEEIIHRSVLEFTTPESTEIAIYNIQNGVSTAYEVTAVHKSGNTFPIEVAGKSLEYDGEEFRITVVRDITERKRNEHQLKISQANLSALIENTNDSIWSIDEDYRLTTYNSAYEQGFFKRFGKHLQPGVKLLEIIPEDSYKLWMPLYDRAFKGERFSFEYSYQQDGEIRFREVAFNPIISGERITGVAAFGRDTTERKRSEEFLKNSQANLSALIENTNDPIWSVDRDLRLITFNTAFAGNCFRAFGVLLSKGMHLSKILSESAYEPIRVQFVKSLQGERVTFEAQFTEGKKIVFREISLSPITTLGQITGVVVFGRDITERKRSEVALQKSQSAIIGLIENTTDSIWSLDHDYCLLTYNSVFKDHFLKVYGILPDVGVSIKEILPPEVFQSWLPHYQRAFKGERFAIENQTEYQGRTFYTEVSLNPIITNGEITGVATFSRSITDRKQQQEELLLSKANISALIENTTDSIWSIDNDSRVLAFNHIYGEEFLERFGKELYVGALLSEVVPQETYELWAPVYKRAFKGERFSFEFDYKIRNEVRFREVTVNPIISEGRVTGVTAFSHDITAKKRSELALKTSQANISALIENLSDSFWSVDREYRLLTVNTIFSNIYYHEYGIRLKAGDSSLDVVPPEALDHWISLYDRCFDGESITFDYHHQVGKELHYYEISLNPIIADGAITGAACVSRDITERKKIEEKIREHSVLLDKANEAIIVRDLEAKITFWNKAAEKMYGWTTEEVLGRSIEELSSAIDTIHRFTDAWDELLFSGHWSGEIVHHNKNGTEITTLCQWTLVLDTGGKPKSVLAIHTDITEQKNLQQQFYRSQRMESLGTLASGIAHDLNNILTPILLSVEILRLKYPEEKKSDIIEAIDVSAKRGAEIVRQVLIFASGISGDRNPLSLSESIREIGMIVRKTFSKSIELRIGIDKSAKSILGDSTQIQQVLMNLCVNARDAMPDGGEIQIELESTIPADELLRTTPEARSVEYTVLRVSDTGTGIPQNILEKIFDPFFTTKNVGSGTGLGLSTVNAIVKSHNGFMRVYNKDKGAAFEAWFPAFYGKATQPVTQEAAKIVLLGQGKTILIVEDEPLVLQLIGYSLEKFNFTILTANDGNEALRVFKNNPQIELVLSDINMPGMEGTALLRELRYLKPSLKFIIMTGLPVTNTMSEMRNTGVSSFLAKPFKTHTLLKAIENAFDPEHIPEF